MDDLPNICTDSSFLVFIPGLKCKVEEDGEEYKYHEDINVSPTRQHVCCLLMCAKNTSGYIELYLTPTTTILWIVKQNIGRTHSLINSTWE